MRSAIPVALLVGMSAATFAGAAHAQSATPLEPRFHIAGKVVADRGVLYFASTAPYMYAVSASDGSELWRYRPPASVDDIETRYGIIYLVVGDELHALDPHRKSARWIFEGSRSLSRAGIAFDQGVVLVEETFGNLYAVDKLTGRERWRVATDGGLMRLLVTEGLVLSAGHAGVLRAIETRTGRMFWKIDRLPDPEIESAGKWLIVHTTDGWMRALDRRTGRERWRFQTFGAHEAAHPQIKQGRIYVFARKSAIDRGTIYAVDLQRGKKIWSADALAKNGRLELRGRDLFMVSGSTEEEADVAVYQHDARTGKLKATRSERQKPQLEASRNTALYVDAQSIRAVDKKSGEARWKFRARFFEPDATIRVRGTPPLACPLGLEPTSAVRIKDWASKRLDLGTTVVSTDGHASYVAHEVERKKAVVFRMAELGQPEGHEVPIRGDIWGAAAAADGRIAIASQLSSAEDVAAGTAGQLAVHVLTPEQLVSWTTTVAPARDKAAGAKLAWSETRIAAVWMSHAAEQDAELRAAVLDPRGRVVLGAITVVEQQKLDYGARLLPGELDVAWDGEAFSVAYARVGPGSALSIHIARVSAEGALLDVRRIETLELPVLSEGLLDLAGTPSGLGIVYAGKFGVLYRTGRFKSGPVALPRHPRANALPSDVRVTWNGSLFGIAWGLSRDDTEAFVTVADLESRIAEAVPLGRGAGAQYFELAPTKRGFFAVHIPDEAGGRKPRTAVGTWLACRRD